MSHKRALILFVLLLVLIYATVYIAQAWTPKAVINDELVRMPGTQPGQVSLEASGRCLNCHSDYNQTVEPGFNWMGSMMAQAARDFLFWSCMTVSAQDAIWAVGTPNATDICERCHFPKGWLEGRSDPTNASLMNGADYDGIQCDFCHRMYDPFFEYTYDGSREGADWASYWDENGNLSQPGADETLAVDRADGQTVPLFNGGSFITQAEDSKLIPWSSTYLENGSGQFFISADNAKRASFADAAARHKTLYSRYHKSKYFCGTCHDVSNPILANLGLDSSVPADQGNLVTEQYSAYNYFHVERTFSEFMLSAYGQYGGAPTNIEFQTQGAPDITQAAKCQDCHMRDVVGEGGNKKGAPVRPTESSEHPNSGQPLHDLTGGNAWVSTVLASAVPGSPNHDPINESLLGQGPAILTLDMTQGVGLDPAALLAGADRAKQQLQLAATIKNVVFQPGSGDLTFRIQNNTGHKLISGFPEGRRMFVNVRAYDSYGQLLYEINPYDATAGTLKGLPGYTVDDYFGPDGLLADPQGIISSGESYTDALVYEMHPSSSLTGEQETFHFALSDGRYKDNRIPPKGFDISSAAERHSEPVWHGTISPDYFTADEYAGGYDDVSINIPIPGAASVEINLYYQTTSREYIEFLRDEINGTGSTLNTPTPSGDPEAYIIQSDPFFDQLSAWGNTLWQLWKHNMNDAGAAPYLMAQGTWGESIGPCTAPVPSMLTAAPGHSEVALTWDDVHTADPLVVGYNLYYDQAGKAQLVQGFGQQTVYTDSGLTNGQEYCYKATSLYGECESDFGNILCATPNNQGQEVPPEIGVDLIETGKWVTTGKGKNKVISFEVTNQFNAGDQVIIRAHVIDSSKGTDFADAAVSLQISGPETQSLISGPSDGGGWAEASWQTEGPNKKGQGGTTPGQYSTTVTDVVTGGYEWDGIATSTEFTIQ